MHSRFKHGFSLVELSVVLVVIGFLVGGIMAGASLIRSSEIRSAISDIDKIKTAIELFQEKYGAMPGDITNATSLWSDTANGDGDGYIESNIFASGNPESLRAWQHLTLSGLMPGTYTGTSAASSPHITLSQTGQNVMTSKVSNGFYFLWNAGSAGGIFDVTKSNCIHFGSMASADVSAMGPVMYVKDAADFDRKIDDGIANKGNVYAMNSNDTITGTECSANFGTAGADYNYASTSFACRFFIWIGEKK